jgi:hypothetical protein
MTESILLYTKLWSSFVKTWTDHPCTVSACTMGSIGFESRTQTGTTGLPKREPCIFSALPSAFIQLYYAKMGAWSGDNRTTFRIEQTIQLSFSYIMLKWVHGRG